MKPWDLEVYLGKPRRKKLTYSIPAPIIDGKITCLVSKGLHAEPIRIDTGADVSVLPRSVKKILRLKDRHSVGWMMVESIHGTTRELVFLVNFELQGLSSQPIPFPNVHVVFQDNLDVPLFGIWTALEHVPQLMCDFPGMRTSM